MKRIIIIGAGVAGLATGIYAQRNGYQTRVYESHYLPGGMCTAWKRKAYLFEGCLHFIGLFGATKRHRFHRLWEELGVFPGMAVHAYETMHEFMDSAGRRLRWYADADRLEAELLALSPADAVEIRTLCRAARLGSSFMRRANGPLVALGNLAGILRLVPMLKRFGGMPVGEYALRFQDRLIRRAISQFFVYPSAPSTSLFIFMGTYHMGGAGYPLGSSLALAGAMEARYRELGGEVCYRRRVARILVENGRAQGVELADGSVDHSDTVVSAADLHATCVQLLGDRFTPPRIRERFASQPLFNPMVQVSLGVNMDLAAWPHSLQAEVPEAFVVAGEVRNTIWFQHFACDPSTAPEGKTALTVLYPSSSGYWQGFDRNAESYRAEKAAILAVTIAQLERIIPGISGRVEVSDVATPLTTMRYTGNWQGALGFQLTAALAGEMQLNPQYTFEGLEGFYQAGQWVRGLGVPMAASSGKEIVQRLCREDRRSFAAC